MNENHLMTTLKKFKKLNPDEAFCRTSLTLITREEQVKHLHSSASIIRTGVFVFVRNLSFIGTGTLLLVLTIGAFNFLSNQSPLALNGVNLTKLVAEAESISISIDLPEIQYTDAGPAMMMTTPINIAASTKIQTPHEDASILLRDTNADEINRILELLSE